MMSIYPIVLKSQYDNDNIDCLNFLFEGVPMIPSIIYSVLRSTNAAVDNK